MEDKEVRQRVALSVLDGIVGIAVTYVSARLMGLIRPDNDPFAELWQRGAAAVEGFREGYKDVQVSHQLYRETMDRARELLKEDDDEH